MSKFRPLGKHIIARPLDPEELKTEWGLILPESGKPDDIQCEVLAVGRRVEEIEKGDRVLVPRTLFKHKVMRRLFIEEEHVLCGLEEIPA